MSDTARPIRHGRTLFRVLAPRHRYSLRVKNDGDLSDQDQLANFRAVTDTKLGRLDVENLLMELLERVRGILDADTAAVLSRQGLG